VDLTSYQPEAHELPATASTPSSLEASVLPGALPSPAITLAQEIGHEVIICTQLCYFYF
jgi:hypothetical protein